MEKESINAATRARNAGSVIAGRKSATREVLVGYFELIASSGHWLLSPSGRFDEHHPANISGRQRPAIAVELSMRSLRRMPVKLAGFRHFLLLLRRHFRGIRGPWHTARPELPPRDLVFGFSFFFARLGFHRANLIAGGAFCRTASPALAR
jgi:hypothetical protein